jgi:UDP-N-acetylglucosamine--N-acetylmuramyl-(pentapeptide) pyrophosphoryl-undecaprenol N-acetylglucosamine transferase
MSSPRIIISGGGTGGHVFPAIAIADAIKHARPEAELLFVGAQGRLEMDRVPKAGYDIEGLWISGFQRRLTFQNLMFPFKLISSLRKARSIVKKFRPDAAVGVGGYASGPLLRVASGQGIPTLIQEQNSFPGITNRLLSGKVSRVCVAYSGMDRWFPKDKIVLTGNPVRKQVTELGGKRPDAARFFELNPDKPTLLVIGGSLGARTINESIAANLDLFVQNGYQLIWQTGKGYAEEAAALVKAAKSDGIRTYAFIDKMDFAYAMADAVVSRAGAMSVSELCLAAKPCILVPSPNVAEDHQTKNAMALVNSEAALLVKDAEAGATLRPAMDQLLSDPALRSKLAANITKLAYANAAERIAEEVLKLIENN